MGILGKKLRGLEGGRVAFMCPGCEEMHQVKVEGEGRPCWSYNGDPDAPTFTPSIKVTGVQGVIENGAWTGDFITDENGRPKPMCCHSFVTDGRIQFLGDCTHALAGQTVDLPDLEGLA